MHLPGSLWMTRLSVKRALIVVDRRYVANAFLLQIISEVDEQYFQEGDVDCSEHELQVSRLSQLVT